MKTLIYGINMNNIEKKILNSFNDLIHGNRIDISAIKIAKNFDVICSMEEKQKEYIRLTILQILKNDQGWLKSYSINVFLTSLLLNGISVDDGFKNMPKAINFNNNIGDKIEIFWNIVRTFFNNSKHTYSNEYINELFMNILGYIDKSISVSPIIKSEESCDILIITTQLLSLNHAPTRETLDYAKGFIELGYKVLIAVTNEMPHTPQILMANPFCATLDKNNNGKKLVNYQGCEIGIEFFLDRVDVNSLSAIVHSLSALNPRFVFAVGGYSFVSELMGRRAKLVNLPCITDLSASRFSAINFYWYGDKVTANIYRDKYNLVSQKIECDLIPQYSPPVREKQLKHEDFQLDSSKIIGVVVGNRLNDDIDSKFIGLLKYLVESLDIQFLIIGQLNLIKREEISDILLEKVNYLDFYPNLIDVFDLCDFYINPLRKGGGTSAAYAMASGLPVYTANFGDISKIVDPEDNFSNYDEMKKIVEVIKKRSLNLEKNQKIINRFKIISDKRKFINNINELIIAIP
jgi:glycosyltransferase involved in cell wall biosynthesis